MLDRIADFVLWIPGLLLALTVHEYAHGRVAYALGDPTPRRAGRLTLNPLAHLDPFGTVALLLFHIGWAKPVPVNPYFFRNPLRDMVLVSAAGPAANLLLATASGALLKLLSAAGVRGSMPWLMVLYTMDINVILMVFNLIPVPPLDGSKVLFGLLRVRESTIYALEQFGPTLLLVLIFLGGITGINVLWILIHPAVAFFNALFAL